MTFKKIRKINFALLKKTSFYTFLIVKTHSVTDGYFRHQADHIPVKLKGVFFPTSHCCSCCICSNSCPVGLWFFSSPHCLGGNAEHRGVLSVVGLT